jgi:membrane-associated protease RseP (regulator of RpoE activity)
VIRVLRQVTAVPLIAAVALVVGPAVDGAAPAPSTTAPATTTAPAVAAPPAIDSVRLPAVVSAQQGHARFLVGVRLATPAALTVQVIAASGGKVVQTRTDPAPRPAGRAYLRIEATDGSGFQLLPGSYRVRLQATDDKGRVSPAVESPFQLKLTPPRGLFDAYTVPLWRAFRRQSGATVDGQLVAVVGAKGAVAGAGLRRGDVITSLAGRSVASPGAWSAALRALPADAAVPVEFVRKGAPLSATLTAGPDWEASPDLAKSLVVAVRREPRTLAYSIAQARQLVEAGKLAATRAIILSWPKSWRTSAPGELVQAELLTKQERWKPALGAYNRARKRDKTLAAAEFGRGVVLAALTRMPPSGAAFAAASRLDPTDPAAAGFQAYALINAHDIPAALAAAQRAVTLDARYADAFLPFGISLLANGDKPGGVKALRRGLVLLEDADRAETLIAEHLNPTDP